MGIRDALDELDYLDGLSRVEGAGSELVSRQIIVNIIEWAELILGVAVYALLFLFTIIVLLDIAYFNIPPLQSWVDNFYDKYEGNKKRFTKMLISQRAKRAMEKSYETGQNVSLLYIRYIFPMFIMVSVALAYAVAGLDKPVHDFMWKMADIIVSILDTWSR